MRVLVLVAGKALLESVREQARQMALDECRKGEINNDPTVDGAGLSAKSIEVVAAPI